jgi:hypothetical protein
MKPQEIMELAPVDWEKTADKMTTTERREVVERLEAIAERAAMLARYFDERYGWGCGDQGRVTGMKSANKAGKLVHMRVFGYNACYDLSV